MQRDDLVALLARVGAVTGAASVEMIGSQCIHAITSDPPAEVLMSVEVDLLIDDADPRRAELVAALGKGSPYADETNTYVDVVNPRFPFLPEGWEQRALGFECARCLEPHDLTLSKLMAGRLKDYELVPVLLARGLIDEATLRARIAETADLHTRAILLARLQLVLESRGR